MALTVDEGTPVPVDRELAEFKYAAAVHTIAYVPQDKDFWCWAACFVMVRQHFGMPAEGQLSLAKRVFGAQACQNPDSPACNRAQWPNLAAANCDLICTSVNSPLDQVTFAYAIAQGPVEISFEKVASTANHVALVTALRADGTVRLLDPWPEYGESSPPFSALASGYQAGPWRRTYWGFAQK